MPVFFCGIPQDVVKHIIKYAYYDYLPILLVCRNWRALALEYRYHMSMKQKKTNMSNYITSVTGINYLLSCKIQIRTIIGLLARMGELDLFKLFYYDLKNAQCLKSNTWLIIVDGAIKAGHFHIVKFVIEQDVYADIWDKWFESAIIAGRYEIFKYLVQMKTRDAKHLIKHYIEGQITQFNECFYAPINGCRSEVIKNRKEIAHLLMIKYDVAVEYKEPPAINFNQVITLIENANIDALKSIGQDAIKNALRERGSAHEFVIKDVSSDGIINTIRTFKLLWRITDGHDSIIVAVLYAMNLNIVRYLLLRGHKYGLPRTSIGPYQWGFDYNRHLKPILFGKDLNDTNTISVEDYLRTLFKYAADTSWAQDIKANGHKYSIGRDILKILHL